MVTLNLDKARLETKLGAYATANAYELTDPTSHHRTQEYRRLASSRMMALGKEDIRRKLPEGEYHVSRKIDGEFTVLAYDGKQALTVNPGGTPRSISGISAIRSELLWSVTVTVAMSS